MEPINDLIRKNFSTLTNQQKLVASYILNYPHKIAFQTAKELGELTETSETTVIRFCYKLGYTGFSHLQKEIQASLIEISQTDPLEKFRVSKEGQIQNNDLIEYIKEKDIAFIQKTIDSLSPELFKKIISTILYSDKICVVGLRSSYAPAIWLSYSLNLIKGNTHFYRGEHDDAISLISEMNNNSLIVILAFSFPSYAQDTITFAKNAKKKGVKILTITDNELSPIGLLADLLLKVYTPSPTGLKGMPTVFSLLNLLVSGVLSSNQDEVQNRLKGYEATSEQYFSLLKNDTEKN